MFSFRKKAELPTQEDAMPGRELAIAVAPVHVVTGQPMREPFAEGSELAVFGLGCFWGAERKFWQREGVLSTQVGYAAGFTKNPSYEEVCSGRTGHNEVVRVVYDPKVVSFAELVQLFYDSHNPTQGMRQGNDVGTQYRSGIYVYNDGQRAIAEQLTRAFGAELSAAGFDEITTEIVDVGAFYYAEDYHQQYLHKNPNGYCGLGGTGVSCPVGLQTEVAS